MAKFTEVLDTIKTALKRHLNAVLTASPRQVLTHTVVLKKTSNVFLETSNVFSKTSNVFLKTTVSIFGCIHCFQHRFNNSSNTTIRPLFKKVVSFLKKGRMLFEKSS